MPPLAYPINYLQTLLTTKLFGYLRGALQTFIDDHIGVNANVLVKEVRPVGLCYAAAAVIPSRPFISTVD